MSHYSDRQICTTCAHRGYPITVTKGRTIIEIILWLCFLLPGLAYSLWRISTRREACPSCGNSSMIPETSPIGKKICQEHYPDEPVQEPPRPSARAVNAGAALGRLVGKMIRKS